MKIFRILFLSLIVLFVFSFGFNADAESCQDASTKWNTAEGVKTGEFSCQDVTCSDFGDYTCIDPSSATNCGTKYCSRKADCVDLYGAEGYRCMSNPSTALYDIKYYHCPGKSTYVCAKLKSVNKTPVTQTPVSSSTPPTQTITQPPAQTASGCCRQIVPPLKPDNGNYAINSIVQVAVNVYNCVLCLTGSAMVLMFVLGGFMMIFAAGDKGRIGVGKKMIIGAVVGGVIVMASYTIVVFVVRGLGVPISGQLAVGNSASPNMNIPAPSPIPPASSGSAGVSSTVVTSTNMTSLLFSNAKFTNCSASQIETIKKSFVFLKKYDSSQINAVPDDFEFICDNGSGEACLDGAAAFYATKFDPVSGKIAVCEPKLGYCPLSFNAYSEVDVAAFASHELNHYVYCKAKLGQYDVNCDAEQQAFDVMAGFYQFMADKESSPALKSYYLANVWNYGCDWNSSGGYLDEAGQKCKPAPCP